ncbi:MAG: lipid-binding SYLF domain-containing protein [Bryobacteraceae bacterium]
MKTLNTVLPAGIVAFLAIGGISLRADTAAERLTESATALSEIMSAPDKGIPQDLLADAHCVVIVPGVKKVAFVVGGKYGRGFIVCRRSSNVGWGAPAAVRMEGGSIGWQIGGSETDVVMLVMDQRGMQRLLQSKFTLGGSAEVAAGPVGRTSSAETDAKMRAKILTYSRSRGVFAGVSLGGATLRQDLDQNKEMYGRPLTNSQIVMTRVKPPASASGLLSALNRSSRHESK